MMAGSVVQMLVSIHFLLPDLGKHSAVNDSDKFWAVAWATIDVLLF
jgi:hypothetical protein